jgi:acetyltransferase
VLLNLTTTKFGGSIVGVNPRHATILGITCYPSIRAVPTHVDLAVIATPSATVPQLVDECVDASVDAAIVLSGGFKEVGPQGAALERDVSMRARRGGLRLLGPNCLGLMSPVTGLNATFARAMALKGSVGFASQSGALCTAILDWSLVQRVGFSYFISVGSMADVGWAEVIYFLGDDPNTQSILLYMESVGESRAFLSAAREIAASKPIIVLKAGRTAAGARAAAAHTGALTGSDEVLDAAFERCGVLRVDSVGALFSTAGVLAKQPRPAGKRLAIVTNAGGPGVLASDALVEGGGEIAPLAATTLSALDAVLPSHWSHGNPVDVLGDATPERFGRALEIVAKDPNCDGLLVALAPLATNALEVAEQVQRYAQAGKPILASWMGGAEVAAGAAVLERAGIPTFPYADDAARVFNLMWRYGAGIRALFETPLAAADGYTPDRGLARELVAAVLEAGRTELSDRESMLLLEAYGVATPLTSAGSVLEEMLARRDTYELLLGSRIDSQFGPVLYFGKGRERAGALEERALALPPLTTTLARRAIEGAWIAKTFRAERVRPPIDDDALLRGLVRFSILVVELRRIKEIEVNALLAGPDGAIALSSRVVLHPAEVAEAALPSSAIRAYPSDYASPWTARDGSPLTIRPLRPEDEAAMRAFYESLSEESLYLRYAHAASASVRVSHDQLARLCFIDYALDMALVVEIGMPSGELGIVGLGTLMREHERAEAEFAILVADAYAGLGIGGELLRRLVDIGRLEGIPKIVGYILHENHPMLAACRRLGFAIEPQLHDPMLRATIDPSLQGLLHQKRRNA